MVHESTYNPICNQAFCLRTQSFTQTKTVVGEIGSTSAVTCGSGFELTGCSCAGVNEDDVCQGAKAVGHGSRTCTAKAVGNSNVKAYAICVDLHEGLGGHSPMLLPSGMILARGPQTEFLGSTVRVFVFLEVGADTAMQDSFSSMQEHNEHAKNHVQRLHSPVSAL